MMLGSWPEDVILEKGYGYPFEKIDSILKSGDIVFTNLEAPFGEGGAAFPKKYSFQVKPELVNVLETGHINLVSLANNHIMDFGEKSMLQTRALLEEKNIHYAGAGMNITQAREAATWRVGNRNIAFVAYSLTFPEEFWASDTSAGTCFPSHTFVYKDIRRLNAENDLVIVSCHWGQELLNTPKEYQVKLAHKLIDAGADLILGHHPHVIQGIEFYMGKLIAYSLGNFIFGSYSEIATESMILKIQIAEDNSISCKIVPINVYNAEIDFQPSPLNGEKREHFFRTIKDLSWELNNTPIVIRSDGEIKIKNSLNQTKLIP